MLVYLDSFSGLIPAILRWRMGQDAAITITATRGAYRRGERLVVPVGHLVERSRVHVQNGRFVIR